MRYLGFRTCTIIAVLVLILTTGFEVDAETFQLELKRIEKKRNPTKATDKLFNRVSSKYVQPDLTSDSESFKSIVKKEPPDYQCDKPIRNTVELGTREYAFALDSTDIQSEGYNRLYFDKNGNGDLTDDGVVEPREKRIRSEYGYCYYPRIDMIVDAGEEQVNYSFFFTAYSRIRSGSVYRGYVLLYSGAYREAEIELNGKSHTIVIQDFNSNGVFNDGWKVDRNVRTADNRLYVPRGDTVYIDPDLNNVNSVGYDLTDRSARCPVSKIICIDGDFYEVEISPSGDELSLTPSSLPLGKIENKNRASQIVLLSDNHGALKLDSREKEAVAVPAGEWSLMEYMIVPEGTPMNDNRPRTFVTAAAAMDTPTVSVSEGNTVPYAFGPPYRALVNPSGRGSSTARLSLKIVGSAQEICTDLSVNGSRPPKPTLSIATPEGEIVERGNFEWG